MATNEIRIPSGKVVLHGTLDTAGEGNRLVLFAHGSGSSRHSPRNRQVAQAFQEAGMGTLLFDLLTAEEEAAERHTGHLRFDVDMLARRLVDATVWAEGRASGELAIGYFGASTGAAAALVAAAELEDRIGAVVSRGGRPDLARGSLAHVVAPTLLIVGERDSIVIELNAQAYAQLQCEKELVIVPGASHLFEEPGTLALVAKLAVSWFGQHLSEHVLPRPAQAPRFGSARQ
jgi:predicted alpha/beta-hydrolase family hydrolase